MKKEKSCGAVVFYIGGEKEQILLIKHTNGGHWAMPKGHVEEGETEEQTAKREIMEETGISVDLYTDFRYVVTYSPKKDVVKDVVYFFAIAKEYNTKRQEEEVSQIMWVDFETAYNMVTYKNDKELISKAFEYYKQQKGEQR